jgi:hypothetical protein
MAIDSFGGAGPTSISRKKPCSGSPLKRVTPDRTTNRSERTPRRLVRVREEKADSEESEDTNMPRRVPRARSGGAHLRWAPSHSWVIVKLPRTVWANIGHGEGGRIYAFEDVPRRPRSLWVRWGSRGRGFESRRPDQLDRLRALRRSFCFWPSRVSGFEPATGGVGAGASLGERSPHGPRWFGSRRPDHLARNREGFCTAFESAWHTFAGAGDATG